VQNIVFEKHHKTKKACVSDCQNWRSVCV